ncbi:MAG: 4-alpha-glucanotransferase [Lachnospiraceae bacterium]|nr:4-alpha-glucanotransferase [Lachnospiraceae bacterium]
MRESGILYPIFSLPSRYGIGCLSKEAYEFVDFLKKSGQGYWQILPIGPTGYGDSPYQPFSAFAGNPYFVAPDKLIEEGLLMQDEADGMYFGNDEERVDYGALYNNRYDLLRIAFDRFMEKELDKTAGYKDFCKKEKYWLEDYCLFTALKKNFDGEAREKWEDGYRLRKPDVIKKAVKELREEMDFYAFIQYEFQRQWDALKEYAGRQNVKIIGDIPFYVSADGADLWAHPEVFLINEDGEPSVVAGCPPDAYSVTGQLWGNPIYDWKANAKDDYDWWIRRLKRSYELFDSVRIDHFHGFAEYYAIPAGDETAEKGNLVKGPGMDFFKVVFRELGDLSDFRLIAEDLGTLTEDNVKLLNDSNIPGMKVLQYAFTSWDSCYITHRHERHCVVYTGTHDNTPTRAWVEEIGDGDRDFTRRYLNSMNTDYGALVWDFIREAYRSVADLCIIPIQDYLVKGREARINYPGVAADNWQWRVKPGFLSDDLADSIRRLTEIYGRIPREKEDDCKQ